MFDRYEIRPSHQSSSYSTITEKRAPTDESVKILREMEKAAKDEVAKTIRLEANGFKAIAHTYSEPWNAQERAVFNFDLAGHKISVDVIFDYMEVPEDRAKKIVETISHKIACEVFDASYSEISRLFRP